MAKLAVLGVTGESGYWLVDFENGTVTALDSLNSDPFEYSPEARASGATLTAGIDLAVVVANKDSIFSGKFDAYSGKFD